MPSSTFSQLPTPPRGKTGWPWTEETVQLPETMPDGSLWPRISIVTPSYNQGQFIEETIRSVLLQGYPNLEYIIMDGGSTDNTVDIIRKYEPWLAYWISEPDRGQSHALNMGFNRATGRIIGWINSDDSYACHSLFRVAKTFMTYPDENIIVGNLRTVDENGDFYANWEPSKIDYSLLILENQIPQPTVFMRKKVYDSIGAFNEMLHYTMDYEYWLRISTMYKFFYVNEILANFRIHTTGKTMSNSLGFILEKLAIYQTLFSSQSINYQTRKLKREAFARVYSQLEDYYWKSKNMPLVRKYFLKSFFYDPNILFVRNLLIPFLVSFFR